jgi:HEAT repeat protein
VLAALRKLTGQDAGSTAQAWLERFPRAELDLAAATLSAEFLQAPANRKAQRLQALRDGKGDVYTEALARSVAHLSGRPQQQARDALVDRLTLMTADTLRDKLEDESAEIRRAAALACGRKGNRELVADLVELLEDNEPAVADGACTALNELTGQNLGPKKGAAPFERARAIEAWQKWWEEQRAATKTDGTAARRD